MAKVNVAAIDKRERERKRKRARKRECEREQRARKWRMCEQNIHHHCRRSLMFFQHFQLAAVPPHSCCSFRAPISFLCIYQLTPVYLRRSVCVWFCCCSLRAFWMSCNIVAFAHIYFHRFWNCVRATCMWARARHRLTNKIMQSTFIFVVYERHLYRSAVRLLFRKESAAWRRLMPVDMQRRRTVPIFTQTNTHRWR